MAFTCAREREGVCFCLKTVFGVNTDRRDSCVQGPVTVTCQQGGMLCGRRGVLFAKALNEVGAGRDRATPLRGGRVRSSEREATFRCGE